MDLVGARGPKTLALALAGEAADGMVLEADLSPGQVRAAVTTAAAARPHEVDTYLPAAAGPGAGVAPARAGQSPARRAVGGSPAEAAAVIRSFADAGATTVILVPTGEDPDVAAAIGLAAGARSALRDGPTR